jgi:hypothetical protein
MKIEAIVLFIVVVAIVLFALTQFATPLQSSAVDCVKLSLDSCGKLIGR